ncbi:UDP-glycosyltransferase UGT5 isoform X2 [Anthonomus grandis grandis]|uniref:UDP-glycosyltransferase UGT5 isoform X2 n=1 Tax=Anthonomus grandis grandis TaxID=2921223 RepID=UPI0021666A35|nr:UDP-glycosyltransferase UGT5 isoform X2 [Anthonomus grandis grandis]
MILKWLTFFTILILTVINYCTCANILMITMGGTKSHKIPFWELARGLIPRGHNVTFLNAFPRDFYIEGLEEITPTSYVVYIRNFTNWDLVGAKIKGEEPIPLLDMIKFGYEACEVFLSDPETKEFLHSGLKFDLLILDGAYPECAMGFVHFFNAPFIYINTVGMYTGSLSIAGNPTPYSVIPFLSKPFTENMGFLKRVENFGFYILANLMHTVMTRGKLQGIVRRHFGSDMPGIYELSKNVSFILQNGHPVLTYSRPLLPNVAEIACLHCKPARKLPQHLENFIDDSGDAGFIYFSMGSSVKASNMPEYFRALLMIVFRNLPQRVLWKYEDDDIHDLPSNVMLGKWLPQQDILGHPKLKAFVTHGGLLSMFETVYHGVPVVSLPVFCDHESNAAKAEVDGYAIKLDLYTITPEILLRAIKVKHRQTLLLDQKETSLQKAVYWTEYVLRHKGATHLQSPSRHMGVIEYHSIDVIVFLILVVLISYYCIKKVLRILRILPKKDVGIHLPRKSIKVE